MRPHGDSFTLHRFRPRAGIGVIGLLVGATIPLVLMLVLVVVVYAGGLRGILTGTAVLSALVALVLLAWRFRPFQAIELGVRPNGVLVGNRLIPRGEITGCTLASGGRLRVIVQARSGDWTSPPLDERRDYLERVVETIRTLVLRAEELADEHQAELQVREEADRFVASALSRATTKEDGIT